MVGSTNMQYNLILTALSAACLIGCGGGTPLTYDEAMSIMRDRTSDAVRTTFGSSPHFENQDEKVTKGYQALINAHVIACKTDANVAMICEPGPAGDAVTPSGVSELSTVAGRWVPASVVAIQRSGRNSATAEVRMSFEPSQLFQDFEEAFDSIQTPGAMAALGTRKQGKVVRATFQRYEDGWHVETVE